MKRLNEHVVHDDDDDDESGGEVNRVSKNMDLHKFSFVHVNRMPLAL